MAEAIDERKIQLLVRRVERDEQFKHLVQNFFRVRVLAVNLVDDHDRLGAGFERLAQHEARLRLRAFGGIHHEQHAVNHVHDALDLAAEIRVAGRVHDVDVVILVFERGVLGADGDALFLLQIHRIHQAFLRRLVLVGAEGAGLFEQAIHERGLAVVNVRDDGDISNVLHRFKIVEQDALWEKKVKLRLPEICFTTKRPRHKATWCPCALVVKPAF